MSNAWEDPFGGDDLPAQETVQQSETPPQMKQGEKTASSVHEAAPHPLHLKNKWLTKPYTLIAIVCGTAFLVVAGYWVWTSSFSHPASQNSSLMSFSEPVKQTSQPRAMPPELEKPMQPLRDDSPLAVAVPVQQSLSSELEQARLAITELRTVIEETTASARGENMAAISNVDLEALIKANATLQQQVEAALQTIKQTKEEKERALKQIAEVEARYAARDKATEPQKKQTIAPQKPAQEPARKAPSTSRNAESSPTTTAKANLPFSIVAATDSFIVVKKGDTEFSTVKVGQTIDGVTILGVDTVKRQIKTDTGVFTLSGAR